MSDLPKGWTEVALGEVVVEARPGFASGDDLDQGLFQFRMNNLDREGRFDFSKKRRVTFDPDKTERFLLHPGDVLFNATNSPEMVGKSAFFNGHEEPAVFSNHFLRLRPGPALDGRYLARWLQLLFRRGVFAAGCRKWVNQATYGKDSLLGLRIPLPPLEEQRRIAAILDKADELRAQRRAALEQLEALIQAIFLDMFGDPAFNPRRWQTAPLSVLADCINDCPHSTPQWTGKGVICVRTSNLTTGDWDWSETRHVSEETYVSRSARGELRPGDLVLSREGTVGVAAIVPPNLRMCMGQRLVQVRPNRDLIQPEVLLSFLLLALSPLAIRRLMVGSTAKHLNVRDLKTLPVFLLPADMQARFAAAAQAVVLQKTSQIESRELSAHLVTSLQSRAFRGEL